MGGDEGSEGTPSPALEALRRSVATINAELVKRRQECQEYASLDEDLSPTVQKLEQLRLHIEEELDESEGGPSTTTFVRVSSKPGTHCLSGALSPPFTARTDGTVHSVDSAEIFEKLQSIVADISQDSIDSHPCSPASHNCGSWQQERQEESCEDGKSEVATLRRH